MYVILDSNGYELGTVEDLTYIKLGSNGCWTIASAGDAEGISMYGLQYNTQDLHGIPGAATATVLKKTEDGVPRKGQTDTVLTKKSDKDYDVEWRKVGGLASYVDPTAWNDFMRAVTLYRMGSDTANSEEMSEIQWFTEKYSPSALNYDLALRTDPSGTLFDCSWRTFMDRIYSLLDDIECTDERGASFFDWTNYEINMTWQEFAFFLAHGWTQWEYYDAATPDDATISAEAKTYLWRWPGSGRVTNPYIMKDGTTLYYWNDLTKRWDKA